MSKVSKTARASSGMQVTQKKVVPDDQLVKMYRDGRSARLWPALEQSDAVLRTLDAANQEIVTLTSDLAASKAALVTASADVEHLQRQLVLANSIIETKTKALADIAVVAGVDPATFGG